jgi:uncharacterized phosphosugar-binding protein
MKKYKEYFRNVNSIIDRILETQGGQIEKAAEIVSDAIEKDGLIHTLGVGHSHIVAEEVFWRAGTLVPVHAILEPSMIGHTEIVKSAYMEKLEGTGKIICDYHKINPPDALIAISNSGNNAMPIDVAIEAKQRGVKTIGICSVTYTNKLAPKHSSGQKLIDVVDVVIDNCGNIGDTSVRINGVEQGLGPTSTIAGTYIIHSILIQAAENLQNKGIHPLVYWSGNLPNGMKANKEYIDKYWERIRNL